MPGDLQPGGLQFLRGFHLSDTDVIKPLSDDYFWPYLGLHRCEVQSMDQIDINGNNIVHLSLSHNNITQVKGRKSYKKFESLEILDLSYNGISECEVQYFDDGLRKRWDKLPQTLQELNLRGNLLTDFTDTDIVLELVNLEYLDLRDNMISNLEPIFKQLAITPIPGLTIALSGNRFDCSCSHEFLLDAISTQQEVGEGYFLLTELHQSLTCATQGG